LDDKHSFGDAQDMKRLEKKLRQIKEKLKICEREREIALNALQQQTEHLNIEKKKRKKLEEEVENLEMMLDLKQSENRTSQTEEGNFTIT
jgi:chromosome segregation ATPase